MFIFTAQALATQPSTETGVHAEREREREREREKREERERLIEKKTSVNIPWGPVVGGMKVFPGSRRE